MLTNVPRAVRVLRLAKGWPQRVLGLRANVSREMVSRCELGEIRGMTIASIEQIASALGASIHLQLRWRGEELDRLMDAAHAALQAGTAEMLTSLGWIVRVEVSFNHYGDRGRVDLLAFHPIVRAILVVEIKSGIGDIQDLLGRLDIKVRLGRHLAQELGWSDVQTVIPALVIGDSRLARRTIQAHAALFARFRMRGRTALAWLRRPTDGDVGGLIWFAERPDSHLVARRRVRRPSKAPNSRLV